MSFFGQLNPSKFLNLALLEISKYLKFSYIPALPYIAVIEPTNRCNFKCPMCPLGQNKISRKKGDMDYKKFKKVINEFENSLRCIVLFNFGEPFLNKDIFKMIKYCKKKEILVVTSINAGILNKTIVNKIIDSGLDYLTISLNGASENTYRIYNSAENFKAAIRNIKQLCQEKIVKNNSPFVDLQFIVMRKNEKEVQKIKRLAKQLGVDRLSIKTAWIFDKKIATILPRKSIYRRYYLRGNTIKPKKVINNWCPWPWTATVIAWDGSVYPCCYDINGEYNFGNVFERSLKTIWNNERYIRFRKQILIDKNKIPLCARCPGMIDVFVERIDFGSGSPLSF